MAQAGETALIVVDVQKDFCTGGALAVPAGESIVPLINRFARGFATVVLTQDWHPPDHFSFAANHPGLKPFTTIEAFYGRQTLWPTHCVMGTEGAAFYPSLDIPHASLILRKGCRKEVDSYSAFLEADRKTRTGLDGWLASRGIREVSICGLTTDFCVAWTALDARRFGLAATVIENACRAIDLEDSLAKAWAEMNAAEVCRATA